MDKQEKDNKLEDSALKTALLIINKIIVKIGDNGLIGGWAIREYWVDKVPGVTEENINDVYRYMRDDLEYVFQKEKEVGITEKGFEIIRDDHRFVKP